jgi:hypothetical protein
MIGVFNRSHYEDVLVVRVHDLVPKKVWSERYWQINEFERIPPRTASSSSSSSSTSARRSRPAAQGAHRGQDEELEVLRRRSQGTEVLGRVSGGVSRTRSTSVPRSGRPGRSCRRTRNGRATASSRAPCWSASNP